MSDVHNPTPTVEQLLADWGDHLRIEDLLLTPT